MRRNRLLQLLADNRGPFTPISARIVADSQDEVTVYLYDPIVGDRATAEWWGGVCPQDFVPALRAIQAQRINLRVNSPGGDVFGAEAMCQAIREHSAHVVAHIEGLAASAATSITCACDEVLITPSSKFMIHETWTLAIGNKRDLRAVADLLENCDGSMYAEYQRRSGNDLAQLQAWCEAETWFSAEQAVTAGFADAVKDTKASGPKQASRAWRLQAYLHAPADPSPASPPANDDPPESQVASSDHRARQQQRMRAALLSAPIR